MKGVRQFLTAATTMLVLVAIPAAGQKSASPNVTSIVHDYDSTGTVLLLRSDDYNGSGQATYTSTTSRSSVLDSWIVNSGTDWNLNLMDQSVRTIFITPNDPVGMEATAPQAGFYSQGVQATTHCFDQYRNLVPLANIITYSGNCTLGVNFSSGGATYKLLMSPYPFSESGSIQPTCPSTGCLPTGVVTVTCNLVNSSSQCVSWTITPNSTAANTNVANLYKYQSTKGQSATWLYIGQYYNTFRIDVTNP